MGVLAKARPDEIATAWARHGGGDHQRLRGPETGLVMVQGRAGGDGAPFNLGEMTVTRCSIRLADGRVGHAWVAGRDPAHAEQAAAFDALLQGDAALAEAVIAPLAAAQAERRRAAAAKTAATRVDFFAMVRGED